MVTLDVPVSKANSEEGRSWLLMLAGSPNKPCMAVEQPASIPFSISQLLEVGLDPLSHQVTARLEERRVIAERHGFRSFGDAVHRQVCA